VAQAPRQRDLLEPDVNSSDWWDRYYGSWDPAGTSLTANTIRGRDGKIYLGNGTAPVATVSEWKISYGDPLWYSNPAAVLYRDGEGVRRVVNTDKIGATTETDLAWLNRRVNEICWVPA
jgi:hypothetical protein